MRTNTFFTLFWMLYFPLCIAFYHMIGMDYSDEVLTAVMIIYAIATGVATKKTNRGIMREVWVYLSLIACYVVYSLLMAVNVSHAVWLDLQQQVRPYAVLYCTWLLNPQFTQKQKSIILTMMLACTVSYALLWRSGVRGMGSDHESVIIGQLSLVSAMAWYLWKPATSRNAWIALAICAIGLFGGKSKFTGEFVAMVALLLIVKGRIKLNSTKTVMGFAVLTAVILAFTWTRFSIYYVDGFDTGGYGYERLARPESYRTALRILFDYFPLGSGLGTFGTHAAAVVYSPLYYIYDLSGIWGLSPENPMFVADAFYPVLAEYGIVGVAFFVVFWRRRLKEVLRLPDATAYKVGLMSIIALALESVADTSYLSGKGMGYFMMLAICLNTARTAQQKHGGTVAPHDSNK